MDTGLRRAEVAAEAMRNRLIERIFSPELPRTGQTADIVNRGDDAPVIAPPALNDIHTGLEGRPVAGYLAATRKDRLHRRVSGGESLPACKARVLTFLDWLSQQPPMAMLVVVHEETLRVIRARLDGLDEAAMQEPDFANCGVIEFEFQGV
jgi:broad specificity phosphatase PhoE